MSNTRENSLKGSFPKINNIVPGEEDFIVPDIVVQDTAPTSLLNSVENTGVMIKPQNPVAPASSSLAPTSCRLTSPSVTLSTYPTRGGFSEAMTILYSRIKEPKKRTVKVPARSSDEVNKPPSEESNQKAVDIISNKSSRQLALFDADDNIHLLVHDGETNKDYVVCTNDNELIVINFTDQVVYTMSNPSKLSETRRVATPVSVSYVTQFDVDVDAIFDQLLGELCGEHLTYEQESYCDILMTTVTTSSLTDETNAPISKYVTIMRQPSNWQPPARCTVIKNHIGGVIFVDDNSLRRKSTKVGVEISLSGSFTRVSKQDLPFTPGVYCRSLLCLLRTFRSMLEKSSERGVFQWKQNVTRSDKAILGPGEERVAEFANEESSKDLGPNAKDSDRVISDSRMVKFFGGEVVRTFDSKGTHTYDFGMLRGERAYVIDAKNDILYMLNSGADGVHVVDGGPDDVQLMVDDRVVRVVLFHFLTKICSCKVDQLSAEIIEASYAVPLLIRCTRTEEDVLNKERWEAGLVQRKRGVWYEDYKIADETEHYLPERRPPETELVAYYHY